MTDKVELQAKAIGLADKYITSEVEVFLQVNGENVCLRALEMACANMRKIARTGLHPGTALKSWRWATRKIVDDAERNEIQKRLDEEQAASEKAYKATIGKGYVPDRGTILAQLEAQYADGKISIQEYKWGMAGLDLVHGYVAAAEGGVDPELGF